MKLANADRRAVLVLGDEIADVATASGGRFGPDPMAPYADWPAFLGFAATVTAGTGPLVEADLRCPVPAPRTNDLVFGVPRLIAELSSVLPLLPGDVVFTGTPSGVGMARQPARYLRPGQLLESWIEGIGTLRNPCV